MTDNESQFSSFHWSKATWYDMINDPARKNALIYDKIIAGTISIKYEAAVERRLKSGN